MIINQKQSKIKNSFLYEPSFKEIEQSILLPIQWIKTYAEDINNFERDLCPLIDSKVKKIFEFSNEKSQYLQIEKDLKDLIDKAFDKPIEILNLIS